MPQSVLVLPAAGGWARPVAGVGRRRPDPRTAGAAQAGAGAAVSVTRTAHRHQGLTAETAREPLLVGVRPGRVREGQAR
ncbi:hypothetical protein [Streptomyces sp. NPDC048269]|uniref:hypothetical protein n=1 Tax=Streptomyces sp. NPDC048269 TaxID=3155753 RepID=UPI00342E717C